MPIDPLITRDASRAPRKDYGSTASTKKPKRVAPRQKSTARSPREIGGGLRLTLCVAAVFASTYLLARPHSDQIAAVASPSEVVDSNEVATAPTPRKLVLVSDPANTAIVQEIAGDALIVESIIPPGANGHTYEPVPGDAIKAATADLYIENGMELNMAVTNFVRANYRAGTPEVRLSDSIPKGEVISTDSAEAIAAHGHAHSFNAHFWTNPAYAILYAEQIRIALTQLNPENAEMFAQRTTAFVDRLSVLDEVFRQAIDSIPVENKKLVVYHDSWSYFGRRYGIPVIGALQPVSFSEPSAAEIRAMIDQIRKEKVPAFFGSEVFPSDVLNAISSETGAAYFSDLSDEELPGVPGTPEHSYEGMMIENVKMMTRALGGNVGLLDGLVPGGTQS
jgi:ABC-type Zn uptake system ZnuABC Zn-binding protein ZnuA